MLLMLLITRVCNCVSMPKLICLSRCVLGWTRMIDRPVRCMFATAVVCGS